MDKYETLKDYFGYAKFRDGQEQIIDCLLSGQDALCVMPTGAGKSLCYQIPALMLPGITIVISPLISLMKDQVSALKQSGIKAAYINSSLSSTQYKKVIELVKEGTYKIIYLAPERLLSNKIINIFSSLQISLFAVDEAHCISQWGQDFRPSYLKIVEFIEKLPYRPIIGAFTATATKQVKDDIISILHLKEPLQVTTGFDRPNLHFSVCHPQNKALELLSILPDKKDKSGIVYCSTRKVVEDVCSLLNQNGYNATRYHAGLSDAERKKNQDDFVYDKKSIIVATNAFGMGIDKSNVSFVIHYNMPKSIESYYQEAGRAGRDGVPAECILLYSSRDIIMNQFFIEHSEPNPYLDEKSQNIIREKEREKLKLMTYYCTTTECLRAFILKYFGEDAPKYCGNCSNCDTSFKKVDITIEAQKILSCIARLGEHYGMKIIIDTLHGDKIQKLNMAFGGTQSTFGLMADISSNDIRKIINELKVQGYLEVSDSEFPVLKLNDKSKEVLFHGAVVNMLVPTAQNMKSKAKSAKNINIDSNLYMELKKLRKKIAYDNNVPAFIIFADSTLIDMCKKLPRTDKELLNVVGVGRIKLEKYGNLFLHLINEYYSMNIKDNLDNKIRKNKIGSTFTEYKNSLIDKGIDNAYKPWQSNEDKQLADEISSGLSISKIAEIHKRTDSAIISRIKKISLLQENK